MRKKREDGIVREMEDGGVAPDPEARAESNQTQPQDLSCSNDRRTDSIGV
jgi:hypothetical protein